MSEASCSSTKSASGRALGPDDLVTKLNQRANVTPDTPFSLTSHLSAGRTLLALRDALLPLSGRLLVRGHEHAAQQHAYQRDTNDGIYETQNAY